MSPRVSGSPSYIPSPHEIAAACDRIRRGWTPNEELSRRVGDKPVRWQVPSLRVIKCSADHLAGLEPSEMPILPSDCFFDAT
jgi:hypothetical protein